MRGQFQELRDSLLRADESTFKVLIEPGFHPLLRVIGATRRGRRDICRRIGRVIESPSEEMVQLHELSSVSRASTAHHQV